MRTWKGFLSFILVFAILLSFPTPVFADRVSDLRQELSSISNELIQINQEYASISERAGQLSQEVSRITTMISSPGADIQSISRRLSEIQAEANNLFARKTTLDERKNYLASRVSTIQQEIDALTRAVVPPPVVNPPPIVTPPPVNPPVTPPPPQTTISGEITNTIFPSYGKIAEPISFRLDIKNTGNTSWNFLGALTIRLPDGPDFSPEKISVFLNPGEVKSVSWNHSFHYAGEFKVIFGIWKDDETPLTRSSWMTVTVSGGLQTVNPPPVTNSPPVVTPPPVVNPPPPVNPPVITPPTQTEGARITGTTVPSSVRVNERTEFRMYHEGTVPGEHVAAATIRKIGGHEEDWQKVVLKYESGYAWWKSTFYEPGNYQIIFGIWRGNAAVTNSGWIPFRVEGEATNPSTGMDGTGEYNPSTPVPNDDPPRLFGEILKVELADDFSSRLLLDQGEEVTIKATIRSTGNKAGNFHVCIDQPCNQTLASGLENKKIALQPGDVRTVSWRYKANNLGNNKLSIFLVTEEREIVGHKELRFDVLPAGYEVDDYGLSEEPEGESFFTTLDEILLAADLFAAADLVPGDEMVITGGFVVKKGFDGLYRVYEGNKILRFVWKVGGRAWDISDEAWSGYLKLERKIKYVAPSFKAGLNGQKYVVEKIGLHNFQAIERYVGRRQIDGVAGKVFDFAGKHFNPGDLIEIKSYERIDGLKKALSDRDLRPQIEDYLKHLEPGKKLVVIFKNRMPLDDIKRFLDRIGDIRLEVINGID